MAGTINQGLELSKQSWRALRRNRQLLVFPLISLLLLTIVVLLVLFPVAEWIRRRLTTGDTLQAQVWIGVGGACLLYLVISIIVIFSNTALIGVSLRLINGEAATVGDGFRIALSRVGTIFGYALISATLGVMIRFLIRSGSQANNGLVKILSHIIGQTVIAAWSLAVFFAIPVMIVEDLGVSAALKRGVAIFKNTWGERFTGDIAIGSASCLVYLLILIAGGGLASIGVAWGLTSFIILGLLVIICGMILINLLYGAVNGIFQASLYHFAVTGSAGPFIDTQLARAVFKTEPTGPM
jgi:uncharacterized membrane protein (DUF485 family)